MSHLFYLVLILVGIRILSYWAFSDSSDDGGLFGLLKGVLRFVFYLAGFLFILLILALIALVFGCVNGELAL